MTSLAECAQLADAIRTIGVGIQGVANSLGMIAGVLFVWVCFQIWRR